MTVRGTNARVPAAEREHPSCRRGRTPRAKGNERHSDSSWSEAESLVWTLQASGLGHWRHDLETDRFSVSEGMRAILGLQPEDELSSFDQFKSYLGPQDWASIEQTRERAIAANGAFELEQRFTTRAGASRCMMIRGRVARCPDVGIVLVGIAVDITAQKASEAERERLIAELAEERARLRALVAHIPAAVLVADASGNIVLTNPAVESVFPVPQPAVPVTSRELFARWHALHPDGSPVEPTERPLSRALRGENVDGEDFRYLRPDGTESWLRIASAPIRGDDAAIAGAVVIAACVDKERRADEALRASERLHRQLFDSPVIGIIYSRLDGRITDANDIFLETFGYTREDLAAGRMNWREMTPPEYREHDERGVDELVTARSHRVYEKEYLRKDGTRVPIVLGGTMVEGSATEIATFVLDIGDRKRVEAERERLLRSLAESEERYRLVALASEDSIYDWNLETDRVRSQAMFGHGATAPTSGASWAALVHPDDRDAVLEELQQVLDGATPHWRAEYRFRSVNGDWLAVADRGYVVMNDEGRPVRLVGAMQDVTLRRRQQEFERQLIGIVSHDLRNPLAAILLASELMLRSAERDPATLKHAQRVKSAGERAMRLVRDLLDFTRARLGGGIVLERRTIDLGGLLQSLVDDLRVAYPKRPIVLDARGDCTGDFDADRLTQVATNLIENALKYSPQESEVRVTIECEGERVRLAVFNSGPAIPADILSRIFEPLHRGDATFDPASRSVGLGLYIVKQLVDAHGGRVDVDSAEGTGTTFRVDLPRRAPPKSVAA